MKEIVMLFIILGSCALSLKGQDSVSFSKNNTDTIYSIIYKKVFKLEKKCYNRDSEDIKIGAIIDLINTTNTNLGRTKPNVNIINNHIYHIYGINEECVSILMLIHDDKAYFFDEYEMWSEPVNLEDSTQWEFDSLFFKFSPPIHPVTSDGVMYVFRHPKKLNALLDFINREGIHYTNKELIRIKHFNSNKWRLRRYR